MSAGYVLLCIIAAIALLLACNIWRTLHKRKVYQRLLDTIAHKGLELDMLSVFASAGHTWLGRSVDGAWLIFIPQNRKISYKYNSADLLFMLVEQVHIFSLLLDGREFQFQTSGLANAGQFDQVKNIELRITDKQDNCYHLLLARKTKVAAVIRDRVMTWMRFLAAKR